MAELGASLVLDAWGLRVATGLALCLLQAVVAVLLLVSQGGGDHTATVTSFAAFYLAATAYSVNPLMYGWANVVAARGGDDAVRAVVLAAMAAAGFVLWTFWGILFYPAGDAPRWHTGCIVLLCIAGLLAAWLFVVRWVCVVQPWLDFFLSLSPPPPLSLNTQSHSFPNSLNSLSPPPVYVCVLLITSPYQQLDSWTARKYQDSLAPAGDQVYDVKGAADEENSGTKPALGNEVQPAHTVSD